MDPSMEALRVARRNATTCRFVLSEAGHMPFRPASMDFGYSLAASSHGRHAVGTRGCGDRPEAGARPSSSTSTMRSITVRRGLGPFGGPLTLQEEGSADAPLRCVMASARRSHSECIFRWRG